VLVQAVPPFHHWLPVPPTPLVHLPQPPHQPFAPVRASEAPPHQPVPVIVENTESVPLLAVPATQYAFQAHPVPTVTEYACGVTVKEALY